MSDTKLVIGITKISNFWSKLVMNFEKELGISNINVILN